MTGIAPKANFMDKKLHKFRLRIPILLAALALIPGPTGIAQELGSAPRLPHPLAEQKNKYKLRLVYFVPQDRQPVAAYQAKVQVMMTFIADLYYRGIRARGLTTEGFAFEFVKHRVLVHLVRGRKKAAYYSGAPAYKGRHQYDRITKEVTAALGSPRNNLYVILSAAYDEGPSKIEWPGTVALGGRWSSTGGIAMFSSWVLRDEFCAPTIAGQMKLLGDRTSFPGRRAHGHLGTNSPRFEFIEDGFGAIAHELGHALGLAHDMRNNRLNIMANGFRNLRVNFLAEFDGYPPVGFSQDNARMLANTRFLNPTVSGKDFGPPKMELKFPKAINRQTGKFRFTGIARDSRGLGAFTVFLPLTGSVVAGQALTGKKATFTQEITLPAKTKDQIKMFVKLTDTSGNVARQEVVIPVVEEM